MHSTLTERPDADARARELIARTAERREALLAHPLHEAVVDLEALGRLTQFHVFAVWDFMQLLKALQRRLAPAELPWSPPRSRAAAGLINQLVLGEESDRDPRGGTISHFELYLAGMGEIGASTAAIDNFVALLGEGHRPAAALARSGAPPAAQAFTATTLGFALGDSLPAIAAAFALGREALIPSMFTQVLAGGFEAPLLRYYFERHVELDGGSHGDLSRELLAECCGVDDANWAAAERAALASIEARAALWDAALAAIRA